MARATAVLCFSLPREMVAVTDRVCREEHRTRSELVREALRRYFRPTWINRLRQQPVFVATCRLTFYVAGLGQCSGDCFLQQLSAVQYR